MQDSEPGKKPELSPGLAMMISSIMLATFVCVLPFFGALIYGASLGVESAKDPEFKRTFSQSILSVTAITIAVMSGLLAGSLLVGMVHFVLFLMSYPICFGIRRRINSQDA